MYLRRASCEYKVETSSGEAPMQEREEDDANAEKSVVPLKDAKTSLAKAVKMQWQQQQQQREEPSCSPRSSSERMLLI